MFINPAQVSVAQVRFLSQMQQLQDSGYLLSSINFGQTLENTLEYGFRQLAFRGPASVPMAARIWQSLDLSSVVNQVVGEALGFRPSIAPDFNPLQALTTRGSREKTVPVIIEKWNCEKAQSLVVSDVEKRELEQHRLLAEATGMDAMAFLVRGWTGEVHGLSIAALYAKPNGAKAMLCCRDIKFDRNRDTSLRDVGPILTIARLLYMKRAGHWPSEGPILEDIRPEVLSSYRRRFPRSHFIAHGDWSVSRAEADHLLTVNAFDVVELPLSSIS